jgi:hypothetical protein
LYWHFPTIFLFCEYNTREIQQNITYSTRQFSSFLPWFKLLYSYTNERTKTSCIITYPKHKIWIHTERSDCRAIHFIDYCRILCVGLTFLSVYLLPALVYLRLGYELLPCQANHLHTTLKRHHTCPQGLWNYPSTRREKEGSALTILNLHSSAYSEWMASLQSILVNKYFRLYKTCCRIEPSSVH